MCIYLNLMIFIQIIRGFLSAQPSSTTLIDDKITTIYHPTFGYLRHIEIIGLDQTTLTLQDLKWTTQ
ncbi:hypothetical protein D8T58_18590 [Vibrio vulnificus]|nr:hypothetical protein D8T58_18590 [Vibrio vulnificus]